MLVILMSACDNISKPTLKPEVQMVSIEDKDAPFLKLQSSDNKTKTSIVDLNTVNSQIMYSAYKRASKYIFYDAKTKTVYYKINKGSQINISEELQEIIEAVVYCINRDITKYKTEFPEAFDDYFKEDASCKTSENFPIDNMDWQGNYESLQKCLSDYRNRK